MDVPCGSQPATSFPNSRPSKMAMNLTGTHLQRGWWLPESPPKFDVHHFGSGTHQNSCPKSGKPSSSPERQRAVRPLAAGASPLGGGAGARLAARPGGLQRRHHRLRTRRVAIVAMTRWKESVRNGDPMSTAHLLVTASSWLEGLWDNESKQVPRI